MIELEFTIYLEDIVWQVKYQESGCNYSSFGKFTFSCGV